MTVTFDDFERVFRATVQEPIPSIFFNRSIDWQDYDFNETRSIVDLTILTVSSILNVALFVVILSKRRLHNSASCYVMSLTISNFVVLLNVLDDVLKYWFAIAFEPDLDFIGRVSLHSSSLTLVTFTLDRFIAFCRIDSEWHEIAAKTTTAVKAILVIWCYASIASALELNLYEHFRTNTIINIFCWSTGMYVLLPTLVILGLDFILVLELSEYREVITTKWSPRDLESLRLLRMFFHHHFYCYSSKISQKEIHQNSWNSMLVFYQWIPNDKSSTFFSWKNSFQKNTNWKKNASAKFGSFVARKFWRFHSFIRSSKTNFVAIFASSMRSNRKLTRVCVKIDRDHNWERHVRRRYFI